MLEEPTGVILQFAPLLKKAQQLSLLPNGVTISPHSRDFSLQMRLLFLTQVWGFFRSPSRLEGGEADSEEMRNFAKNPPKLMKSREGRGRGRQ